MNNQLQIFKNEKLNLDVRTIKNEDGSISINVEDTAIGFGWYQIKGGKKYPKWERINSFIKEFENSPLVGKGDYIPESLFYMLGMRANNKVAQEFQKWLAVEVIPKIRKTGGYIATNVEDDDATIMAKALMVSQKTINKKDELLKAKDKELLEIKEDLTKKDTFISQITVSQNSLKVVEVAQIASKKGIKIGQNRLWKKLREWGMIKKNSMYDPKQEYIEREYFEVVEGTKENTKGIFTYKTTRILGKGQIYIINRLLDEQNVC
ncbi:phage antirepressor [Clostridium paraputrificum]|uniref:phage antirepressor n=1 Tax=Clostridium paraputrificum TaxID=29363 RepID=UPI003D33EAB2